MSIPYSLPSTCKRRLVAVRGFRLANFRRDSDPPTLSDHDHGKDRYWHLTPPASGTPRIISGAKFDLYRDCPIDPKSRLPARHAPGSDLTQTGRRADGGHCATRSATRSSSPRRRGALAVLNLTSPGTTLIEMLASAWQPGTHLSLGPRPADDAQPLRRALCLDAVLARQLSSAPPTRPRIGRRMKRSCRRCTALICLIAGRGGIGIMRWPARSLMRRDACIAAVAIVEIDSTVLPEKPRPSDVVHLEAAQLPQAWARPQRDQPVKADPRTRCTYVDLRIGGTPIRSSHYSRRRSSYACASTTNSGGAPDARSDPIGG